MADMPATAEVATPLAGLLAGVLAGVTRELAGVLGTAVSTAHPAPQRGGGRLQVMAATGVGHVLPPITTGHLWGPSLLAAAGEQPIVAADLWHDPRWPHLTLDAVAAHLPAHHRAAVARVRGVAAVPGVWDETGGEAGVVMVSAYLDRAADQRVLAVLVRYERLVASAITIAAVATRSVEDSDRVLDMLASRAVIEQAKGAIMTLRRCDAERAWETLRLTSQQCNVKVRELALAFVEYVGQAPVQQPDTRRRVTPATAARQAAVLLWRFLTEPALPADQPIDHPVDPPVAEPRPGEDDLVGAVTPPSSQGASEALG